MIKAGDKIRIKAEYRDAGDDQIVWLAIDNEDKGRVTIQPQLRLSICPTQVVPTYMIEKEN